jgi:hypothetical protein
LAAAVAVGDGDVDADALVGAGDAVDGATDEATALDAGVDGLGCPEPGSEEMAALEFGEADLPACEVQAASASMLHTRTVNTRRRPIPISLPVCRQLTRRSSPHLPSMSSGKAMMVPL